MCTESVKSCTVTAIQQFFSALYATIFWLKTGIKIQTSQAKVERDVFDYSPSLSIFRVIADILKLFGDVTTDVVWSVGYDCGSIVYPESTESRTHRKN